MMTISPLAAYAEKGEYAETNDAYRAKSNNFIVENDPTLTNDIEMGVQSSTNGIVTPFAIDPGNGATRINYVTYGSYEGHVPQETKSGQYNVMKETTMWIIKEFVLGRAGSVIEAVAGLVGANIDQSKYATAKTENSYTYPAIQGQVYKNGAWTTYYEAMNKAIYKHYKANYWDVNKNNIEGQKDYIVANGYSAEKVLTAPHYNDTNYILNKANTNYLQGISTSENWTS